MAKNTEAIETVQDVNQAEETVKNTDEAPANQAEETVKIRLPFVAGVMEDDVFVGLNGRTFLIKRGVEVEVPLGVKEILDRKEAYEMEANSTMMRLMSMQSEPTRGM